MKEETPRLTADTENLIKTLTVGTEQWYKIEVCYELKYYFVLFDEHH